MSARVGATHVSDDPPYSPPASNLKATLDGLAMVARRSYTGSPRTGPPSPPHCAPVLFNGGSPPTSASTSPDSAAASSSSSSAAAVFSALAGPALATLGAPTGPGRSLSMNSIPVLESVTPPAEALIPPALRRVPSAGEPPLCQTPLALCEGGPLESLAVDGPCVLYTDIPFLSRFFRLFGHVAVTNSDRTRVYELRAWPWFPSNNSVWVLEGDTPSSAARGFLRPILFGRPSKCLPLGVPPELYAAYDAALEDELQTWRTRMHMGVGSNCHSFICDALNNMHRRAGGTGSPYTILRLGAAVYAHAIPVRRRAPRGLVYGALSDAGKVWQSFVESVMGLHVRFQRGARRQLNWVPGQSVVPLVGALVSPLLKLCYEVTTPTVAGGRGNSNSNYCDGAAASASSYSASSAASAAGSDAEAGSDDAGASDGSHRVHSGNDSDQAVRVDAWGRLRRTPMADAAVLATVNEGANEGSHDEDDDDDGGEGSDDGYEDESKGDDTSAGRRAGRRPLLSQRHSRSRSHDHSPYYGRTGSRAFMGPTAADIAAATADCGSAEGVPLTGLGVLQAHDSPQWHRRRQSSPGGIGGDGPCTKECCAAPLNSTFRGNDGALLCDKECCAGGGNTAYARYYHSTSGHSRSSSVGAVALDSAAAAAAAAAVAGVLGSSACRDGKDCAECNRTAHSQPAHGHDSLCNEAKSNSSSRRLSLGSSTGVGTDGGSSNGTCCSTGNTAAQKQEQRQEQRQEQGQGQGQRLGQGQSKGFCWCEECTLAVASSSNNSKDSPPLTGRVVSVKGSYAPAAFPPFTNACNEVVTGTGTGDIAGGACSGVDCWCDTLSGPSAGAHYACHHKHAKATVNGSTAAAAAAGGLGPGGDTADGCGVSGGVSTSDRSFLHSVSGSDNSSHPRNLYHHDDDDDDGDDGDGEAGLDSAGGVRGRNGRRHSSGDAVSGTYSRGVW